MVKKLERTASWKPRMGAHRAAKVHTKQNSIDCDIEEDLEGEIDDKKGEYKDQMDKDESNEEDRSDKENDDHCGTKRKRDEPLGSRKKHKQLETKRHRGEEEDVNPAPLKKVRAGVSASIVRHFARVALQDKHKDRKSNVRDKEGTQKNTQSRLAVARTSAREGAWYPFCLPFPILLTILFRNRIYAKPGVVYEDDQRFGASHC
ncbi:hypothetical protein C8J56DRAFT_371336 [Mycena floridula]|nr:hypothetical protein C8J56DRAFT_371336 [Mycena floridula]